MSVRRQALSLAILCVLTTVPGRAEAAAPWRTATGGPGPAGRGGAAMAFDPSTGLTVLFGGCTGHVTTTVTVHTKDDEETLLTDESRGIEIENFGWCPPANQRGDLWTWNGATESWTQVTPSGAAPHARYNASMTYDYTAGRITLFGGLYQTDVAGVPDPEADDCLEREEHYGIQGTESVHDEQTGRDHAYWCFRDTWQLARDAGGTWRWTRLAPTVVPPSRYEAGLAYDRLGRPVLIGGCHTLGMMGAHGQPTIPTYFDCAEYAAVERDRGAKCPVPVVTLRSPLCGEAELSVIDTWRLEWTGSTPTWTLVGCTEAPWPDEPPCGPPPTRGAEVTTDPGSGIVYWGGYYYEPVNYYGGFLGATWHFDGDTWRIDLSGGAHDQWCPSLSAFTAWGVSAPVRLSGRWQVLRTGGYGRYYTSPCPTPRPTDARTWSETWRWDGGSCTPFSGLRMCWQYGGSGTPDAGAWAAMAFDHVNGKVVLLPAGSATTWVHPAETGDPCPGC